MSTLARTARRPTETDLSVDVTPVMNMFIILIPFLVSMAAFSHLAVQQLALPGNDPVASARTEAEAPLVFSVSPDGIHAMRGNLEIGQVERFEELQESTDLGTLLWPLLEDARVRFPDLDRVTLAMADEVLCGDVVACFDACREAGFLVVGIAEAVR